MMSFENNVNKVFAIEKQWNFKLNISKCVVMRFDVYRANENLLS